MRRSVTAAVLGGLAAGALLAACGGSEGNGAADVPVVRGDAEREKTVFLDSGCGRCHVLADAGTDGRTGPALDGRSLRFEDVLAQVVDGGGGMPAYGDRLSVQELQDVATYVARFTDAG